MPQSESTTRSHHPGGPIQTHRRGRVPWIVVGVVWIGINAALLLFFREPSDAQPGYDPPSHLLGTLDEVSLPLQWQGSGSALQDVRLRLMSPDRSEEQTQYPLVLFLHGAGPRGDDNRSHLIEVPARLASRQWRTRYPCFLAAPQCPPGSYWTSQIDVLVSLIEALCERYPIDRRRIYLTGLSMGGFGSWHLAAHRPDLFAAVVPICGGGDPTQAERLADVPLWAVHGAADQVVPVASTRQMIDAIRQAGGDPKYTELPGVGHNCWTETYQDENGPIPWMFRQKRTLAAESLGSRMNQPGSP